MTEDKGGKWTKVILIISAIFILIIVLITLFVGLKGLKQFFLWLLGVILFLCIIFGLLYVFWLIFIKKDYKDIPATYKKKLVQTAKLMKNDMLADLYLSGDDKHNRIKLGKYKYLRMTLPKAVVELNVNPQQNPQQVQNPMVAKQQEQTQVTEPIAVDCFLVLNKGIIKSLFGEPIFVVVKPEDHDYSSIFNDVTIKGFNLVPLDSQFYTIDRRNLDIDIIKGMASNYIRETVYELLREMDKIVKQAIRLDHVHQKEKEKGLEFSIPSFGSIGGERGR